MISLEEKQQIILRHYHDGESQRKIGYLYSFV